MKPRLSKVVKCMHFRKLKTTFDIYNTDVIIGYGISMRACSNRPAAIRGRRDGQERERKKETSKK